jgi:hypothetical protein
VCKQLGFVNKIHCFASLWARSLSALHSWPTAMRMLAGGVCGRIVLFFGFKKMRAMPFFGGL